MAHPTQSEALRSSSLRDGDPSRGLGKVLWLIEERRTFVRAEAKQATDDVERAHYKAQALALSDVLRWINIEIRTAALAGEAEGRDGEAGSVHEHAASRSEATPEQHLSIEDQRLLHKAHRASTKLVGVINPLPPPGGGDSDWRDIASAPKDGTKLLLWAKGPTWEDWYVGYYVDGSGDEAPQHIGWFTDEGSDIDPSHWMTLSRPKPPAPANNTGA